MSNLDSGAFMTAWKSGRGQWEISNRSNDRQHKCFIRHLDTGWSAYCLLGGLCDGTHTSSMCESDETHTTGWGGGRWRTACVLWLAAVKIGDGDAEQTWVVIWAMNRTQQERCRWVEISPKAPKICVVNVTYSCTSNSHAVCSDT